MTDPTAPTGTPDTADPERYPELLPLAQRVRELLPQPKGDRAA